MTNHVASQSKAFFSRRSLLLLFALAPIPALISCRTMEPTRPLDAADQQLKRFADGFNALARREPGLPGVQSLAQLNERLLAGFSAGDRSLLTAALYLDARERAASILRPITEADVRAALSRPIDMSRYSRPFLERRLAEAKARAARDLAYRRALRISLPPGTIMCVDETGATYSPALCEFLLNIGILALA
jgi:hypothetical protein